MFGLKQHCILDYEDEYRSLEDYQGAINRWCPGCGDNAILAAVQRLCRDEQLPTEKTVFVSGIGCAARFPHYMNTYGFHGLHGRALAIAEGVRIRRPDLHLFVNMGDGDCCSIGTAHWIHAIRKNMKMVAMMHDNGIYALTKNQVSPTTPEGMRTATTPYGAHIRALNPLSTTLGVTNASFVAQVVEWIPELLYQTIKEAFHHPGFSFIRILQRCPHFTPDLFTSLMSNPDNILVLTHENGVKLDETSSKIFKTREEHDPSDLHAARELAELQDKVPVGILYRDPDTPRFEDVVRPRQVFTAEHRQAVLEREFDRFGIFFEGSEVVSGSGNGDGA
jgi:2-oxoglutarate ferredoxin oxidoreductase subunit beta